MEPVLPPPDTHEAYVSTSSVTLIVFGNRDAMRLEMNGSKQRLSHRTGSTPNHHTRLFWHMRQRRYDNMVSLSLSLSRSLSFCGKLVFCSFETISILVPYIAFSFIVVGQRHAP